MCHHFDEWRLATGRLSQHCFVRNTRRRSGHRPPRSADQTYAIHGSSHAKSGILAWWWYGETMDRGVIAAAALLLLGGVVLVLGQGPAGQVQLLWLLAVTGATIVWGVDNTLSRGVADRDPGQVVVVNATLGAVSTVLMAWLWGEPVPGLGTALALLARRCHRLRPKPALLPARATRVRRCAHGLGLRLRALHRRAWCLRAGRPVRLMVDGPGWCVHGLWRGAALGRAA